MNVYTVTYFVDGKVDTLEQIATSKDDAYWLAKDTIEKQYGTCLIISVEIKESK